MEKLKKFLKDLIKNLAYDIVKTLLLSIFTTGLSFPVVFVALKKLPIPLWCVITVSIAIVSLILFFVLLVYQKLSYKYIAPEKIDSDYNVINKSVKFTYDGEKSYYETEITLQFNKKSREYYGKYYWSGSGDGEINVVNPNYKLNILKQRTRYIEYVVIFDKAYKKDKKLTFKLKGSMSDPKRTFSPYFATSVDVPTKRLKITLHIDKDKYPIRDLEKEAVRPHKFDHENCEPVVLNCEGEYIWEIDNPQLSYQYTLTWLFNS